MNKSNFTSRLTWLGLIWFLLFLGIPLLFILLLSFSQRGTYGGIEFTLSQNNFLRLWDPLYLSVLFNSLKMSLFTTLMCWLLGIIVAWEIGTSKANLRNLLLLALAIPSLTNLVVRIYAINNLVSPQGLIAQLLFWFDPQIDTFELGQNIWITYYGMFTTYLPFMVFPLVVAIEKLDPTLIEAGADLGAGPILQIRKIIWPQLRSASLTGALLVFIPSMGEYLIPDLLGGAKVMMTGNLISEQFLKARDWPFGSAVAILLLFILAIGIFGLDSLGRKRRWR